MKQHQRLFSNAIRLAVAMVGGAMVFIVVSMSLLFVVDKVFEAEPAWAQVVLIVISILIGAACAIFSIRASIRR